MSASSPPLRSTSVGAPVPTSTRPPRQFISSRRAESGGTIRLILAGELDLAALLHFQAALDAALDDAERVLLDLGALSLIDCSALGAIFGAAARARHEGTAMTLVEPHGQVRRMFDLVGVPPGVGVLRRGDIPDPVRQVAT